MVGGGGGEAGTVRPPAGLQPRFMWFHQKRWLKPGLKRPVCEKCLSFSTHINLYKERRRTSQMAKEMWKPHFQEKYDFKGKRDEFGMCDRNRS